MKTEIAEHEQAKIDALAFLTGPTSEGGLQIQATIKMVEDCSDDREWPHKLWFCRAKTVGRGPSSPVSFGDYKTGIGIKTNPDLADILGSYARDYMDANRAGSFEDWAGDLGYDIDSRKAEETYRACLAQRKPLMQLGLSMDEIEKIAEFAYQF